MGCTISQFKTATNKKTKGEEAAERSVNHKKNTRAAYYMKVLMVGTSSSGKSTVAKQMKILHSTGFTSSERSNFKMILISNIILSLKELITQAQMLHIDIEHRNLAEMMEKLDPFAVSITPQLVEDISSLWFDKGVNAAYARRNEFDLPSNTEYCITRASKLMDPDYNVTDEDILHARQRTSGIVEYEFQVGKYEWNLIDVGGQRAERRKWVHVYQNVVAVIYITALDEWDVALTEDPKKTRMEESLEVFESMTNHEWFQQTPWILFLNKKDLFEQKIKSTDMSKTFAKYEGGNDFPAGVEFIKKMFLNRIKKQNVDNMYVHVTCALDTEQVKVVFDSVMDWIFQRKVEMAGL